jgi:hypothetical protein
MHEQASMRAGRVCEQRHGTRAKGVQQRNPGRFYQVPDFNPGAWLRSTCSRDQPGGSRTRGWRGASGAQARSEAHEPAGCALTFNQSKATAMLDLP